MKAASEMLIGQAVAGLQGFWAVSATEVGADLCVSLDHFALSQFRLSACVFDLCFSRDQFADLFAQNLTAGTDGDLIQETNATTQVLVVRDFGSHKGVDVLGHLVGVLVGCFELNEC